MIRTFFPARRLAALALVALCFAGGHVHAQSAPAESSALTADDILHAVREGQASRHESLDGQLRNDEDGKVFPFRLVADGPMVRYQFSGTPPTTVQVRYNEENSELQESTGITTDKLTPVNFDKKILGTTLTYEDLALRFFYWSKATMEGEDTVKLRKVWKLRLNAPNHRTQYSSVNLWVDKESSALMRAEAYDWQGQRIKRFEVVSGQKLDGKWYLKQMRVENLDPGTDHANSRTYLEIKGLAK